MKDVTVTIQEEYSLPSKGLLYNTVFDPTVRLRSMTVAEEMKRLSHSENPYKTMSEIIEDCILNPLPISVYDLCIGDYTYLLHRLRVVTYGPEYKLQVICPVCGHSQKVSINLDEIKVRTYDESIKNDMIITLPKTKKVVELRFQTPRDLDQIEQKRKEMLKNFPEMSDPKLLLTLSSFIKSVDGEYLNPVTGLESLKSLPLMDMNYLAQKATKLNEKVGLDNIIELSCEDCNSIVKTTFRYSSEFFGPAID